LDGGNLVAEMGYEPDFEATMGYERIGRTETIGPVPTRTVGIAPEPTPMRPIASSRIVEEPLEFDKGQAGTSAFAPHQEVIYEQLPSNVYQEPPMMFQTPKYRPIIRETDQQPFYEAPVDSSVYYQEYVPGPSRYTRHPGYVERDYAAMLRGPESTDALYRMMEQLRSILK
jgi:hypothetical protein